MACWRLSTTSIFTFSNSLMVNRIKENASKSMVILKIYLFYRPITGRSNVRVTLEHTFSNFLFGGWQIRAAVMYSMHVSIAASICFWIAGTLFPYCCACTIKHDCNKNESAKNFAIFFNSREFIFFSLGGQRKFSSLYRVANWTRPHLHWRRNLQFHYIEKMTFRFLIMKLAKRIQMIPNPKSLRLQFSKTGSIFNNKNRP